MPYAFRFRSRSAVMLSNAIAVAIGCAATPAAAGVVTFAQDLDGFNAATGNVPVAIDFDSVQRTTILDGQTIKGATFQPTGGALEVLRGADTETSRGFTGVVDANTNRLFPTSGVHVVTPGGGGLRAGPDPDEVDGMEIAFTKPVSFFGFDHLSQSADGAGFTTVTVYNAAGNALFSGSVPISNAGGIGGGAPGAADFWGIVSDAADITRVSITENDGDATFPDSNIGIDTLRFTAIAGAGSSPPPPPDGSGGPGAGAVPLPAAVFVAPLMFATGVWAKRKLKI
jgi:hypothetical protein